MQRLRVVPALRQRLGDDGTETLVEMTYSALADSREDVLNWFDQRVTRELSALKVDITKELAQMRVEILRWSFVFWITQLGAMAGLIAYMK
jgi:hypothetical protein